MLMKLWQFVLFCGGVLLPALVLPFPYPPALSREYVWVLCMASGIAVAWLGSVGIWYLATFARGIGQRRESTGAERIGRRP